jgi:hypothetical protein
LLLLVVVSDISGSVPIGPEAMARWTGHFYLFGLWRNPLTTRSFELSVIRG